jgi:competence protein ComEC
MDLRLLIAGAAAWISAIVMVLLTYREGGYPWITPLFGAAVLVLLLGAGLLARGHAATLGVILLVVGVAALPALLQVRAWADPVIQKELQGEITAHGVVAGTPQRIDAAGPIWAPATRWRILVNAELSTPLPLALETDDAELASEFPPPGTPITFTGKGRSALGNTRFAGVVELRAPPVISGGAGLLDSVANAARRNLMSALGAVSPASGGVIAGLTIGDESLLPAAARQQMQAAGLAHLTAVSGGNVAIVVGAAALITALLRGGIRARAVVGVAALGMYVVLVRPQPSVVRAAVMGGVVVIAFVIGGRRSGPAVLGASTLMITLLAPFLAVSWGFALSVVATAGIIIFVPALMEWGVQFLQRWITSKRIAHILIGTVVITAVAQVMTAPVLIAMGAQLSPFGIPANALAMPAVPVITMGGLLIIAISFASLPVAQFLAALTALPAQWIMNVAAWASQPMRINWLLVVAISIAVVSAIALVRGSGAARKLAIAGMFLGTGSVFLIWLNARQPWAPTDWSVVMCDVGQGDGLVLRDQSGIAIAIDTGPRDGGFGDCLVELGVHELAAVVMTHFHADHVGGLQNVLRGVAVQEVFSTITDDPEDQARLARETATFYGKPITALRAGHVLRFGDSELSVIWPERVVHQGSEANNTSVVLLGQVNDIPILLTGDIEPEAQAEVMRAVPVVDVAIAKVPHHGSRFTDPRFAHWANAEIALISVGADNEYGHPAPSTITQWEGSGARVFRTDLSGSAAFSWRPGGPVEIALQHP